MKTLILFIVAIFLVSVVNSRTVHEGKSNLTKSQTFITLVLQLRFISFWKLLGMQPGSFRSIHPRAQTLLKPSVIQVQKQLVFILNLENINYYYYFFYSTVRLKPKGGVKGIRIALNANAEQPRKKYTDATKTSLTKCPD